MIDEARKELGSARIKTILLSANAFWNIANFRDGLVRALVQAGYRVVVAAPGADAQWAEARGSKAVDIPIDRSGLNPFRDLRLLSEYVGLLRQHGATHFVGFTAKPNVYGCMAARLTGASPLPNVSGLGTAFMTDGLLAGFVGWLYRIAFRKCPIVFFQNPDDRDLFVERHIVRSDQARLLPGSGVDLDRFSTAPTSADGIVRFLLMGRLLGDKGVMEFVEAARLIKIDHPEWRFQMLGPVDEGNRTGIGQTQLKQWVNEGAVEYLGEAQDVRPFISSATAVVLPSYREGLPRSLLEAAAMARPLVATDVPGNREIVQHGINGLLCRARDPSSLAEAMQRLGAMNQRERRKMGQAGRALVEQSYSERRVIGAYLEALAQLQQQRGV